MIDKISNWLVTRVSMPSFQEFLRESLVEFCGIETIPTDNLDIMAGNEQEVFTFINKIMAEYCPECVPDENPISEKLHNHSAYTKPYYTEDSNAYNNRKNLLYMWESDKETVNGKAVGLNAHIDTVPPYLVPFVDENIVYGRGACDDKGGCLNIIAALRLLNEIGEIFGIYPCKKITSMFVIDEETGGNGSLSLSLDKELMKTIDTMIVIEPTNQQIHPANRGALWYKVELTVDNASRAILVLLKVVFALEEAGRKLRSESKHELFPERPVQTCQGIFGPYGEHPSRICDRIEFIIKSRLPLIEMDKLATEGINEYTRVYGKRDPDILGYSLKFGKGTFQLEVPGNSGHMGASLELDNAIVKVFYIIERIFKADKDLKIGFPGIPETQNIILEGGQGFLPSHTLEDVEKIIKDAVMDAVSELDSGQTISLEINFDKLHNDSFSGNPRSESVVKAVLSAEKVGIPVKLPLSGFPVSCDARLFANSSGKETLTVGPGRLEDAHSNREKMNINELASSSAFLALHLLIQTGAIGISDHS